MNSAGLLQHSSPFPARPHARLIWPIALVLVLLVPLLTWGKEPASPASAPPYPAITVYVGSG